MLVDYNNFAETFSNSRKNMKWEEIDYFINNYLIWDYKQKNILDIWCGSARLLEQFSNIFDISKINYLWLDLSDKMLENAKNNFPDKEFLNLNMLDLDKLWNNKYDYIFFIASFHHLNNLITFRSIILYLVAKSDIIITNYIYNNSCNFKLKFFSILINYR